MQAVFTVLPITSMTAIVLDRTLRGTTITSMKAVVLSTSIQRTWL